MRIRHAVPMDSHDAAAGPPPDPVRTFVALYPSPAQLEAIVAATATLDRELRAAAGANRRPPLRWTRPHQAHLTLAFLGDVPRERLQDVSHAVRVAASRHAPFEMAFRGVGAFPDASRPRVVWAGLAEGREAVEALAAEVRGQRTVLDLRSDGKPFRPHLTLARVRGDPRKAASSPLPEVLERHRHDAVGGAARADEIAVVTSRLGPEGATHERIARLSLGFTDPGA